MIALAIVLSLCYGLCYCLSHCFSQRGGVVVHENCKEAPNQFVKIVKAYKFLN